MPLQLSLRFWLTSLPQEPHHPATPRNISHLKTHSSKTTTDVTPVMDTASRTHEPASGDPKTFLDLPAEIRNKIYRYLFNGQEIAIRHDDKTTTWQDSGRVVVKRWLSRDRALGLNILFASKATLAEARPMLLVLGSFEFKRTHVFPDSTVFPQVQQGFGRDEFQFLQSVVVSEGTLAQKLTRWLPSLQAVQINGSTNRADEQTLIEFKSAPGWGSEVLRTMMGTAWRYNRCWAILDHVKGKGAKAQFLLRFRVWFRGEGNAAGCYNAVSTGSYIVRVR